MTRFPITFVDHVSSSPQSELLSLSGSLASGSGGTYTALAWDSCSLADRSFSIRSAKAFCITVWLGALIKGFENSDHSENDSSRSRLRSARLIWNLVTRVGFNAQVGM